MAMVGLDRRHNHVLDLFIADPPRRPGAWLIGQSGQPISVSDVVFFAVMYLITGLGVEAACIDISLTAPSKRPNQSTSPRIRRHGSRSALAATARPKYLGARKRLVAQPCWLAVNVMKNDGSRHTRVWLQDRLALLASWLRVSLVVLRPNRSTASSRESFGAAAEDRPFNRRGRRGLVGEHVLCQRDGLPQLVLSRGANSLRAPPLVVVRTSPGVAKHAEM
jgi:hypothetical protein